MKTIVIVLSALLLQACCIPVFKGYPMSKSTSECWSEKGTQAIKQADGSVQLTGATTCANVNSPIAGLPIAGVVGIEGYGVIISQPDTRYKSKVAQMRALENARNGTNY